MARTNKADDLAYSRAYYAKNKALLSAKYRARYNSNDKERLRWKSKPSELVKKYRAISRLRRKEANKLYNKTYCQKNKAANASKEAKRRSAKLNATPIWLTEIQLKEIQQFYIDREFLTYYSGTVFEVDHIIPLKGKLVSGLHVPWNLQLLTEYENRFKGNR